MNTDWKEMGRFLSDSASIIIPALLMAAFVAVPGLLWFGPAWIAAAGALVLVVGVISAFQKPRP